ncbi:MAG: FAD-dependent oxidoreductase [Bacilli bacterium]
MKLDSKVVIIGTGVAGMTAALYLKRASIDSILLDSAAPGGQINKTWTIDNYPGITHITGPELAMSMLEQLNSLGVTYQYGEVINIVDNTSYKTVITKDKEITCEYVIIATGRSPRKLGLPGENELTNRGISWCAICDGPLYKGKDVAVIGGGNSAIEESLYLSNICSSVTIIHRKDQFTADNNLVIRLKEHNNIRYLYSSSVETFLEKNNKLEGLEVKNLLTKTKEKVMIEGCFIYIGQVPNTDFITNLDILDKDGYILVTENQETKVKNIFACGDVTKKILYQIVTATADGAVAATTIINR